ncbi:penicillin-binding protein activator LpoB [Halarcobacter mediterraneus]|uniref:Penicillin-binding protein activator LpoB n=1 Tax=Halarcobacter mediterraneus TaxID=2023153 RepID=A0A4V1M190_9BACT|nr:penicillin-binding protein activator LpoB [Halarcobacter mediterraneus]RXK12685.1 penicillin-binding protein activator LpoB [Halarcobacter mediterraneus]
MKKIRFLVVTIFLIVFFTACSTKSHYVGEGTKEKSPITLGLDSRDFEKAASNMVKSLLESGTLNRNDTNKSVLMISDILNDTTQRVNVKMLTKKIRVAILKSGKAIVTTALGTQRDDTAQEVRKLRGNEEFRQDTIAKKHTLYAPNLSLSGEILQRVSRTDDDDQYVEYYFQMTLTNIESGLAIWEDETIIEKVGSNDSVIW